MLSSDKKTRETSVIHTYSPFTRQLTRQDTLLCSAHSRPHPPSSALPALSLKTSMLCVENHVQRHFDTAEG